MDYTFFSLDNNYKNEKNSVLKRLAGELTSEAISYTAYVINEYDFCTEDLKLIKTTQNNVVSIKGLSLVPMSEN